MNNKDLIDKFKISVAMSNFEEREFEQEHTLKNNEKGRIYAMNKKMISSHTFLIVFCFVFVGRIIFWVPDMPDH